MISVMTFTCAPGDASRMLLAGGAATAAAGGGRVRDGVLRHRSTATVVKSARELWLGSAAGSGAKIRCRATVHCSGPVAVFGFGGYNSRTVSRNWPRSVSVAAGSSFDGHFHSRFRLFGPSAAPPIRRCCPPMRSAAAAAAACRAALRGARDAHRTCTCAAGRCTSRGARCEVTVDGTAGRYVQGHNNKKLNA